MAESLFATYENGQMEVTHNGEEAIFELPTWMKEAGKIIEDEEKLLEWAKEEGILLNTFHAAMAKWKIDFCQVVRPKDVPGEKKGEKIKVSLIEDIEAAQDRADKFKSKPASRPGTGGKTEEERAKEALKLFNSLPKNMREAMLAEAQAKQ